MPLNQPMMPCRYPGRQRDNWVNPKPPRVSIRMCPPWPSNPCQPHNHHETCLLGFNIDKSSKVLIKNIKHNKIYWIWHSKKQSTENRWFYLLVCIIKYTRFTQKSSWNCSNVKPLAISTRLSNSWISSSMLFTKSERVKVIICTRVVWVPWMVLVISLFIYIGYLNFSQKSS